MTSNVARGVASSLSLVCPRRRLLGVVADALWVAPSGPDTSERKIESFDVVTGQARAALELGGPIASCELTDGVFVRTSWNGNDAVEAFDLAEGKRLFSKKLDGAIVRGSSCGRLVAAQLLNDKPHVVVLDARSGNVLGAARVGALGAKAPERIVVSETHAVAILVDGVASVDLQTGRMVAKVALTGSVQPVDVEGNQLFVKAESRGSATLVCIDMKTGRSSWIAKLTGDQVGDGLSAIGVGRERVHVVAHVERAGGPAHVITRLARATGNLLDAHERSGRPPGRLFEPEAHLPRAELRDGEVAYLRHVDGHGAATTRLPLPARSYTSTLVDLGSKRLFVIGLDLLSIDLQSIPVAPTAGA